jgi:hypothetical protein
VSPDDARHGPSDPPESVQEALERAQWHARRALAETLAAARALLDALSLALAGQPSDERRVLGLVARGLDELAAVLGSPDREGSLLDSVAAALDAEIARWEERARSDRDARAVLRAYLGLREILWELGVGRRPAEGDAPGARRARPGPHTRRPVQRVEVEG